MSGDEALYPPKNDPPCPDCGHTFAMLWPGYRSAIGQCPRGHFDERMRLVAAAEEEGARRRSREATYDADRVLSTLDSLRAEIVWRNEVIARLHTIAEAAQTLVDETLLLVGPRVDALRAALTAWREHALAKKGPGR